MTQPINIKKYSRYELLNTPYGISGNTIVLPAIFYEETVEMCKGNYEKAGFLYCHMANVKQYTCYLIEYIRLMTVGSLGNVKQNKLIVLDPVGVNLAIEFHIHPRGLDSYWHDKFSTGDFHEFEVRERNPLNNVSGGYKHVLFTPTHVLTYGAERPDFKICWLSDEQNSIAIEAKNEWIRIINQKENNNSKHWNI